MKALNLYEIGKWNILECRGQKILGFEEWNTLTEETKDRLLDMKYFNLGNGLVVEETTYQVVYIPIEETKKKINLLSEVDRMKLGTFFKQLKPREGQPTHSDVWSQTHEFLEKEFHEFTRDTTHFVEMYERGDFSTLIENNRFTLEEILNMEEPEMEM